MSGSYVVAASFPPGIHGISFAQPTSLATILRHSRAPYFSLCDGRHTVALFFVLRRGDPDPYLGGARSLVEVNLV